MLTITNLDMTHTTNNEGNLVVIFLNKEGYDYRVIERQYFPMGCWHDNPHTFGNLRAAKSYVSAIKKGYVRGYNARKENQ